MYSPEAYKKLKETFGTDKIGNCRYCIYGTNSNNRHNNQVFGYGKFKCGDQKCKMIAKLDMIALEERLAIEKSSNISDSKAMKFMNKVLKLNLIGFDESIQRDWVIRGNSETGMVLLNYKQLIFSSKTYTSINIHGDFAICYNADNTIEIYSKNKPSLDLASGLPNLKISQKALNNNWSLTGEMSHDGHTYYVIISSYCDRIALPFECYIEASPSSNLIYVTSMDRKLRFSLDQHLDVQTNRAIPILKL